MNKRSLLFLICCSISFFILHFYFNQQNEQDLKEQVKEKQIENEKNKNEWKILSNKNKISISQLPIKKLYKDVDLTTFEVEAFKIDDSYLILSKNSNSPKILYADKGEKLTLITKNSSKQEPLLYSTNSEPSISVPYFSETDYSPVQLLCLSCDNDQKLQFATHENGYINIPFNAPKNNAIVLFKKGGTFYPVGVFETKSKRMRLLREFLAFKNLIKVDRPPAFQVSAFSSEKFYVIENDYLQLVFSTKGGALSEINLPLKSKTNKNSVVNPINFDRVIQKDYPKHAYFPQHSYTKVVNGQKQENLTGTLGEYYPLLRRSLNPNKPIDSRYYALNVVSNDPDVENLNYKVVRLEEDLIELEASQPYRKIRKTISFSKDRPAPYCVDVRVQIEGDAKDLWMTSGIPEVELSSGSSMPVLKYRMTRGQKSSVDQISLPSPSFKSTSVHPDWVCNSNGFLGMILDPLSEIPPGYKAQKVEGNLVPTRLSVIDPNYDLYPAINYPGYELLLPLKGRGNNMEFRAFLGPFATNLLQKVDNIYSDPAIRYNPDYQGAKSHHGFFSFIFSPLSKLLFFMMNFFHMLTGSWAFSIILLTIALKIMLYPLNAWTVQSQKKTQECGPKLKALQNKYKKDPQKQKMETMKFYKEQGINPLGGCLAGIIQMPFLFGMFNLLKSTFELRGAPFIPGWINDLAAPDVLFSWSYPLPLIGTQFHLLPILSAATLYFQQKFSSNLPKDSSQLTDQQKQQKMMSIVLPAVLLIFFYNVPSGLNIYFFFSNLLGFLQQWYMTRKQPKS